LDEAQNTTKEQMKMFLTRMGEGSKVVVTGDITQIDLDGKQSGLVHATDILSGVEGIGVCKLTAKDVVRHPLVMRIIRAYETADEKKEKSPKTAVKTAKKEND
jgi:phosphate starvation-inducible PhoH-like protein